MNETLCLFAELSDERLLVQVKALAAREREATVQLIAALAELDARRLYLREGFPSLFAYCTLSLHFSESAAYNRIEAARAVRRWPVILELLADGSVTLTTVRLLGPHLTDENHRTLLDAAKQTSKREVEQQVAALHPLAPVASTIRALSSRAPSPVPVFDSAAADQPARSESGACAPPRPALPAPRSTVAALAPERYKVQMTIDRETHDTLRRVQALLRHQVPTGDPAVIFSRALTLLLKQLERTKLADVERPRSARQRRGCSRHVPACIRREVWKRDGGQCAFIGTEGRCPERGMLEFHHVVPYADGGATDASNLQLRCRAHNAYEADEWFGAPRIGRK